MNALFNQARQKLHSCCFLIKPQYSDPLQPTGFCLFCLACGSKMIYILSLVLFPKVASHSHNIFE